MSYQFNRWQVGDGLAKLLGIKGRVDTTLAREIVPVVIVHDALRLPYYGEYGRSVGGHAQQAAGGAGLFSAAWVFPAPQKMLTIRRITIFNQGAATQQVAYGWYTAADITAAGGPASSARLFVMGGQGSELEDQSDTNVQVQAHASLFGGLTVLNRRVLQVSTTQDIEFESPGPFLRGDSSLRFGVCSVNSNVQLDVSFEAQEWPLPG